MSYQGNRAMMAGQSLGGGEMPSISTDGDVKQQMGVLVGQLEELELAVSALMDTLERGGVLAQGGPEAPMAIRKTPEPRCPLSGAIHEAARRVETKVYMLRDLRVRTMV